MKTAKTIENRRCAKCGDTDAQVNYGFNRSGTQRCRCNVCKCIYTYMPKVRAYPDEVKETAIKVYYSGISGRGVGKVFGMSKANVYNWIKKNQGKPGVDKSKN